MKSFSFNLIPKEKIVEKIQKEEKRDDFSLISAVLPLIGVISWLILVLVNGFIIKPSIEKAEAEVKRQENLIILNYANTIITNGELVIKTNAVADVIDKDIQPEQVFLLVSDLFKEERTNFLIKNYSRSADGMFSVNIEADNFLTLSKVARKFNNYTKIDNVVLLNTNFNEQTKKFSGTISFYFLTNE